MDYPVSLDFLFDNTPRHIPTNWLVITGAPSSGKTTLIRTLAALGYKTNLDISRYVIEKLLKTGLTLDQIYQDGKHLQRKILFEMILNAKKLPLADRIFHDYSFPDNIPFLKLLSIEVSKEFEIAAEMYRYNKVFVCEPLPFEKDGIRRENPTDQLFLYEHIRSYYLKLGYQIVYLPAVSIGERIRIITESL
ncbi:ATP-binding protein [Mucilaginibacter flavus]|uniref:ATP-binding protein n=1 Tax=Mucilaginibacter flavus TaxID=931504 RepID=UPI0025B512DB|nr:ATP-binding protein [Mucilaginibacter flavus]MDN3581752.1 ATP-binding protein [Mucilaginibacter flavus]